jgi:hypothetical protein
MKKFLVLGLALTTTVLHAEIIKSKIHSIEDGIVKFENGRVAFTDSQTLDLSSEDYIEANVDTKSTLISFKKTLPEIGFASLQLEDQAPAEFVPTIVQGMAEANNIFDRSNPNYKRISECTDRAHVWAFDEFKRSGTKSEKVFVLFTASYINSVRLKWWFHVAPLYTVNDGGSVKKIVMDFRYTDRPMTVKEWTDQFVFTKRECKVTTKFSEYDVNPQTENCYLMYETMHYRIPADISAQETGRYKNSTSESELKASYRFAFQ